MVFGPMSASRLPTAHYGVTDIGQGTIERTAELFNGTIRPRPATVAAAGRPMGAEDAEIPPVLDQLVNVQEAPESAEIPQSPESTAPTLAERVDVARAALAALAVTLERLTPDEWDGGD
jgi:hypothetical protein